MHSSSPGYNTYTLQEIVFLNQIQKAYSCTVSVILTQKPSNFSRHSRKSMMKTLIHTGCALSNTHALALPLEFTSTLLLLPRRCCKISNTYKPGREGKGSYLRGTVQSKVMDIWKLGTLSSSTMLSQLLSIHTVLFKHPVITIIQKVHKSMHIQT